MSTITIGVDLVKSVFSVCAMAGAGHVQRRQDLGREALALGLAQVPAGTVVAMEVCSGAHYWARRCLEYGLQPRIMAAQFVTPFRMSRTAKNDRNDAEAIATAARQGKHALRAGEGCRAAGAAGMASRARGLQGRIAGHRQSPARSAGRVRDRDGAG